MRTAPYNSRDTFYKSKFGSVREGESFTLRVLLPRDNYVKGVVAVFNKDNAKEYRFELLDDQNTLDNNFYTRSCEISLEEGLYFYNFIMYTVEGERRLYNLKNGIGEFDAKESRSWQLTVYDKDFLTPKHTRGGIIYQIFPDRFYKGTADVKYPSDRYIKHNWKEIPEHRQEKDDLYLGNDYYLGNLNGIAEKLDYLVELGVSIIYLNPIFEAHSNHRYNTADYMKIDSMLGSEEDFQNLCKKAKKKGIDIIIDGVFSHTGDDSLYFNKKGRYGKGGAYNDKNSPYRSWYKFKNDKECHSWWGVKTLPEINEDDISFTEFITGENGVIDYWMKKGASGVRLDVADELPDAFLDKIRVAVKRVNPEGYLLGEVWEDATNKISYEQRRRFLRGKQLDSVMNYPFYNAIVDFILGGNGWDFEEQIMSVVENYPKGALHNLMNHIGTHDTPRILTLLGGKDGKGKSRDWQAEQTLTCGEYEKGKKRLFMAAMLQYTLIGIPSLYYGDEVGMSGYGDPFCRGTFPWDDIDSELLGYYKKLGSIRRKTSCFAEGDIEFLYVGAGFVVYRRFDEKSSVIVGVNRWCSEEVVKLGIDLSKYEAVIGKKPEGNNLVIDAEGSVLLVERKK